VRNLIVLEHAIMYSQTSHIIAKPLGKYTP